MAAAKPIACKTNLRVRVIVLKRGKILENKLKYPKKKGRKFLLKTF
jgi:hypothetical protein